MGSTDQLFLNAEFLQDLCVLIEPDFQNSDAMFITAKNQFPLSNLGVRNELVSLSLSAVISLVFCEKVTILTMIFLLFVCFEKLKFTLQYH